MNNTQAEKKEAPSILQSGLVLAAIAVGLVTAGVILDTVFGE